MPGMSRSRPSPVRNMILSALFAALTAVGAFLKIPLGITSLTLQTFFTAMAGVLLGPKWGALSQAVYVAMGLVGLPIFTLGGGPSYFLQPSMGFLLGLIPSAAVTGCLSRRGVSPVRIAAAAAAGMAVMYLIAVPYMYLILHLIQGSALTLADTLRAGMLVYLPGDALKLIAVSAICPVLRRRLASVLD